MTEVKESIVDTPLGKSRVWSKGRGKRVCFLAGIGGAKKWTPFLDKLAEHRKVIVPSLPGFPGGASADSLDQLMDWILAACDVLEAADCLDCDLVGASVGATLAAEIAAFWPDNVKKLVLFAPFGLFDADNPVADIFAQRPGALPSLISANPGEMADWMSAPDGIDPADWEVESLRANIATANLLWPIGDTRLRRRLWRITAPTLVLWGSDDRVMAPAYARTIAAAIGKNAKSRIVKNAGHALEFDQPALTGRAVADFLRK